MFSSNAFFKSSDPLRHSHDIRNLRTAHTNDTYSGVIRDGHDHARFATLFFLSEKFVCVIVIAHLFIGSDK